MTKARSIAQLLTRRFMAEGKIVAANQRIGTLQDGYQLAADRGEESIWTNTEVFSNRLAVMSVGVKEGTYGLKPGELPRPEVVIFATGKPSARFIKSLPKEIDGVLISVATTSQVGINPEQALVDTTDPRFFTHKGRVACGSSCATATGSPGTLGALVKRDSEEAMYILSCNHVLAACNLIPLDMPIISPAPNDAQPGGSLPTSIARLSQFIPMQFGDPGAIPPCEADAAIGRVLDPDLVSSWQGNDAGYDTPYEIADPEDKMEVKKFGRSTGLTFGRIYATDCDQTVIPGNIPSKNFKAPFWFQNFAHVIADKPPFACPGDSGSLVVTRDGRKAIGLPFSANSSGDFGQIIPIRHILSALDVALISGHAT